MFLIKIQSEGSEKMNAKILKVILFSVISVFCFTILFINLNRNINNQKSREILTTEKEYYTIKEYEGKVAVFKNSDTTPLTIYEAYISLLPESDRQRLKNGILVDNSQDLQRIIEDYTS